MQRNIFLEIEYLGTNYFGFQVQAKARGQNTVQAELEKAIKKLLRQRIRIAFAGRTDRGVHAKAQVVNFKTDSKIPLKNIKKALNTFLPCDIRVKKIKQVPLDFHARFSAKSKVYRYTILQKNKPSVFCKDFSWYLDSRLNLEVLRKVSKRLIGKKDFYLFAKEAKKYKDCIRVVKEISVKKSASFIYIDIEASGFLRNMARNIVSFLVKVASGTISLSQADLILKRKENYSNKPAPAQGLCLYKVKYS